VLLPVSTDKRKDEIVIKNQLDSLEEFASQVQEMYLKYTMLQFPVPSWKAAKPLHQSEDGVDLTSLALMQRLGYISR
jgi:hypothetical protein